MSEGLQSIEQRIFTFREVQVMIDSDLAEMYQVETKVLNQAVKRNISRFPQEFRFQLTQNEWDELAANYDRFNPLRSQTVTSKNKGGRRYLPYVFTEQGVAMLSAVLRSDVAIQVSIQIMNAFVAMRKTLQNNQLLLKRMERMELKQVQADQKFEQIFKALESKHEPPEKGVFFDGQVFDAHAFISDVIRQAKQSIILVDNYIDDTVLTLLAKRSKNVKCTICTKNISKQLKLDVEKHNAQYAPVIMMQFDKAHDRFLIIDETELYHLGASVKDLGKKWFAFSKMDAETLNLLENLKLLGYE